MNHKQFVLLVLVWSLFSFSHCKEDETDNTVVDPPEEEKGRDLTGFYLGADLSYVNQILDHNGIYKDGGVVKDPYTIFKDHGTNLVRLRLWHNPAWTKEVYGANGTQLYNDLYDVEKAIKLAKAQGLSVLLDFHYSDTWADPQNQKIPAAWQDVRDINILRDSVFNYTRKTLLYLDGKGLMPELVQLGNETNCGMLYTDAPEGFPACNVCNGAWQQLGTVLNGAIAAVKEVTATSAVKTKILLHVADPKNVEWWFDNITTQGAVTNFDMIGFSFYPLWHTTVSPDQLSDKIASFRSKYSKQVMILETAYPWTPNGDDGYNNQFGSGTPVTGFPYTRQGQADILRKITQEVLDGGGIGVIYWEPAWITSSMKDSWGTGSSWENCAFFDFDGNTIDAIDFTKQKY
ncbi:MAG TPA: glycosyl hydrolase 53 family protein [Ohtaekwangia sp.]|uniref:glycoside hydrolase family 53 protein n=1 Tax=Ohtaekwangia sp. TaxID=2066019 RepID=UPI002F94541D